MSDVHSPPAARKWRRPSPHRRPRLQPPPFGYIRRQCLPTAHCPSPECAGRYSGPLRAYMSDVGSIQRFSCMCGSSSTMGRQRQRRRREWLYSATLGIGERQSGLHTETGRAWRRQIHRDERWQDSSHSRARDELQRRLPPCTQGTWIQYRRHCQAAPSATYFLHQGSPISEQGLLSLSILPFICGLFCTEQHADICCCTPYDIFGLLFTVGGSASAAMGAQ